MQQKFRIFSSAIAVVCLFASRGAGQGIPEPDLVMYGTVLNVRSNANIRLGYGTLTWVFQPSGGGPAITATANLTNINDQFSYVLRIPCETPVPGFSASSNTIPLTPASVVFNRSQVTWNSNLLTFVQPSLTNTTFLTTDRGRIERVDLDASLPVVIDVNGLPVDWELLYFGRTGIDPNADPDGDGLNNYKEYKAGTNPNDAASVLRFTEILSVPGGIRLKWLSEDYKFYALQRSASLAGSYLDIVTGIAAAAPTNTFLDATATRPGPYFYRLRIDEISSFTPLEFTGIRIDPLGGVRVDWLSASSQFYTLQRSSNLSTGFFNLITNIVATPPVNSLRDSNATGAGPYFYRLRLEP